ncbi:ABC transporter permease [Parafrankia sp. FMc6]|uniref:ABC transporter permease n=1 Tax=Parafrankia soli TaxID=2599596 RepID=UPI0034D6DD2B
MDLTAEHGRWHRLRAAAGRATGPVRRTAGPVRRTAVTVVGMSVLLGLVVCLYGSTVTSVRPRGLPVVVAGQPQGAKALTEAVERMSPGALRIGVVPDAAAADRVLRDRKAYAAFVITDDGLALRLASAASPAVAEALVRGMSVTFPDLRIPVVDVVPNASADHQGGGVSAGYLPLVLITAAAGVLLARAARTRQARLGGLVGFMVATGVAGTLALGGGLDVLPDTFGSSVVVLAMVAGAVVAPVLGLGAVAGGRGLVAAVGVTVLGAALSGASSAPEMLPTPWGGLGQLLPPGAGVTLLRSTLYFDGAGGGRGAVVLAIWAVAGIVLILLGRERAGGAGTIAAGTSVPSEATAAPAAAAVAAGLVVRPREATAETSPSVSPREGGFRA